MWQNHAGNDKLSLSVLRSAPDKENKNESTDVASSPTSSDERRVRHVWNEPRRD